MISEYENQVGLYPNAANMEKFYSELNSYKKRVFSTISVRNTIVERTDFQNDIVSDRIIKNVKKLGIKEWLVLIYFRKNSYIFN